MADFPYQFVGPMLQGMHNIRNDIGTDPMHADRTLYNITVELLVLTSMMMKAIQDIAPTVANDAFWQQRLNTAIDTGPAGDRSAWPGWILLQVPPEDLAKYGATLTDTVPALQAKIDAYNAAAH